MTNSISLLRRTKRHLHSRWIREVAWFDTVVDQIMRPALARTRR